MLVDTFDYIARDDHGATSNSATVSITVTGINDAPVANPMGVDATEDGSTVNGNFAGDDIDSDDDQSS